MLFTEKNTFRGLKLETIFPHFLIFNLILYNLYGLQIQGYIFSVTLLF